MEKMYAGPLINLEITNLYFNYPLMLFKFILEWKKKTT